LHQQTPPQAGFVFFLYNQNMNFQIVKTVCAAAWDGECVGPADLKRSGITNLGVGVDSTNVATITGIECLFERLLTPVPAILALVAVGMIIYSGIRIMTAGPDAKALTSAWNMFTWAVIGLILMSGVWLAITLISKFTGNTDITKFGISL